MYNPPLCAEQENNIRINSRTQDEAYNRVMGPPLLNFWEGATAYMYAQSDAWQEYRSIYSGYNVATQVLRDFVYLKPNSLVIWDPIIAGGCRSYNQEFGFR